jgi:predicted membrane protein
MNTHSQNKVLGLVIIGLGLLLLLDTFDVINFWKAVFPLALVIIGLLIIFKHKKISEHSDVSSADYTPGLKTTDIFGDIRISGLSEGVGTVERSLVFGDIVIDLTGAGLSEGMNKVDVSVVFGDITVLLPSDFAVKVDLGCYAGLVSFNQESADGILPSIKRADDGYETSTSRLSIKGRARFGDVKVIRSLK